MENIEENAGSFKVYKEESQLPSNYKIVSEEYSLPDRSKKEIIILEVETNQTKTIFLLAVKTAFGDRMFSQMSSNIENKKETSIKGIIDPNLLTKLYAKKHDADNQRVSTDDSLVIAEFESILAAGLKSNSSDIHIEVRPSGGTIKMRMDGDLYEYERQGGNLSFKEADNLCSVLYNVIADVKGVSFNPRELQQASVDYNYRGQKIKIRYQSFNAYPEPAYKIVLRILPIGKDEEFTPLVDLGYTKQQTEQLLDISKRPVGSLIISGITGSGKSTTLKNLLMFINALNGYKIQIYTIEDPPEFTIPKVTQIPVIPPKDSTVSPFEGPIKACMRGDPDVIMIGEIRDKQTGDLMKKAIQSGHQVLTTIHAPSAVTVIPRLIDFGLQRGDLGSPEFLTGILYQKLLKKLCPHCKIPLKKALANSEENVEINKRIKEVLKESDYNKYSEKIYVKNPQGCSSCKHNGTSGRTVAAEIISIDFKMLQFIEQGKTIEFMKYWRGLSDNNPISDNMKGKTCMEHAVQKMLLGIVDPFDVEASYKPLNELYDGILEEDLNELEKNEGKDSNDSFSV